EVERRSRRLRLRNHRGRPHRQPAPHHDHAHHHGPRADGVEVLRGPGPCRDRREGDFLVSRLRLARRLAALLGVLLLYPLIAAQTPTPDRDRATAAAKRTEDRLRGLQREADALAAQERTVLIDLRKLEVERQISIQQLNRIERDRTEVQRKLDVAESRAAALAQAA